MGLIKEAKRLQELAGINEVKIHPRIPNNLSKLEQIKAEIKQTKNKTTKIALAIKAAELVLPIWDYYDLKDNRPLKAIQAAKSGNVNTGIIDDANDAYADARADATNTIKAAAANAADAAAAAYYAAYATAYTTEAVKAAANAADAAINATEAHFKLF